MRRGSHRPGDRSLIPLDKTEDVNMSAKTETSGDFEAEDSDKEIYYPKAIRLQGVRMRVRGSYQHGFPIGAIVHSTDGRLMMVSKPPKTAQQKGSMLTSLSVEQEMSISVFL